MTVPREKQIVKIPMMISITFALLMAWSAFAQRPMGSPQDGRNLEEQFDQIHERLALSDQQAEEIRPILEESRDKMRELREKYRDQARSRSTMESFRAEMEELRTETDERLTTVLTDAQIEEYREMERERRETLRQNRGQGERPGQGQGPGQRPGRGRR